MDKIKQSLACGMIVILGAAGAPKSGLLIPQESVSSLKTRAASGEFKKEWAAYLVKADRLCDPESADYADVERLIKESSSPSRTVGHQLARNLIDWMQALGMAYRLTDEVKYREHGINLLLDSARLMPLDSVYMDQSFAGGRGDMMRGLATGYNIFSDALTGEQRRLVLQAGQDYVDDFLMTAHKTPLWWRPYHNFTGVCGGAAGLMALQLRDADPAAAEDALRQIVALIKDWLAKGFDRQGAYFEGALYSAYPLENVILFADLLKSSGGENLFSDPTLSQVVNFYALSMLPGEKVLDARNDSLYENPGELLLKLSSEYHSGVLKWLYAPLGGMNQKRTWARGPGGYFFLRLLWDNDVVPVSPDEAGFPLAEHFEGRGLCIWRTGWSRNDVMFSVEAGPYYIVTHNQADKGHFTLYGYGYRWACDPGYANNKNPNGRAQTVAHNCVLINGKGQGLSGAGAGTSGQILAYTNTPAYGYALADSSDAYRRSYVFDEGQPAGKAIENMDLDHAYRHTFFVYPDGGIPAYAVVLDDIRKNDAAQTYTWQMLSWPDLEFALHESGAVVSPRKEGETNPKMFVFLSSEMPSTITQDMYTPGDNYRPESFPRLRADCTAVNPYFAAVLIPTDAEAQPVVRFENTADGKTIGIEWPGRTDRIVWNKTNSDPSRAVQLIQVSKDQEAVK